VPNRGWYLDLVRMETHRQKDSTPATPAMSLIFALDMQLERILAEGLERRFARHSAMAQRVQSWAETNGLKMYAPPGYRSQTVTTLHNNLELDLAALSQFLQARGMRIAGGYGPLKGKTLRIAHMAETTLEDIERLLQALDEFLSIR
jgi:aspartate aminotransferase-like enzyme